MTISKGSMEKLRIEELKRLLKKTDKVSNRICERDVELMLWQIGNLLIEHLEKEGETTT